MPQSDNIYYYIAYGLILVTFFIVLKMPKKDKTGKDKMQTDKMENDKNKAEQKD